MICRCLLTIMMCLLLEWDTVLAAADPHVGDRVGDAIDEATGRGDRRLLPELRALWLHEFLATDTIVMASGAESARMCPGCASRSSRYAISWSSSRFSPPTAAGRTQCRMKARMRCAGGL